MATSPSSIVMAPAPLHAPQAIEAVPPSDSELVKLCAAFCLGLAEHNALAYKAARDGLDIPIWTGPSTRRLMDQIIAIRATTTAGLKAKITVVKAYQDSFVYVTDMAPDRRLAASIFADLLGE